MRLKNKNLPNFLNKDSQSPTITQIQISSRPYVLSPPSNFYRLERKPKEQLQPKSSSLNNRLKTRAFVEIQTSDYKQRKEKGIKIEDQRVINDYFPERLQKKFQSIPFSGSFNNLQQTFKEKRQSITPYMSSAPNLANQNLTYQTDEKDKRDQMSVSTELSKQSQNDLKNSLKEVKFGGVIQQQHHMFMKKRDKARSPSILKNGRNILNGSILSASKQRSCSITSGKDRKPKQKIGGDHSINHVIKQKYKSIISKLQASSQSGIYGRSNRFSGAVYQTEKLVINELYKYRDDIFPPVYSSLFCIKKNRPKVGEQIKWMRLGDLFKEREMVLAKSKYFSLQITKHDEGYSEDYFPGTFNSLLGCPKILQKMFENQPINPFGIYLIKIYQECVWKYIIVDDYIPVLKTKDGVIVPAFTTVKTAPDSPIDIWPFLLQKAYANYYSSYESLQHGCMIDFAEELSGTPSESIQLKSQSTRKKEKMSSEQSEANLKRAKKAIKAGNTIVIGQLCGDKGYAPIYFDCFNEQLFWNDPFCQFKKRRISFQSLKDTFKTLHIISPYKSVVCSTTVLRKTRPTGIKKQLNGLFEGDLPSIRTFKVDQPGQYKLSIRQRDKRFFHFKESHGEYIWCRAILLQKQYEECGFRWINGCYAQTKSINFIETLECGQYWMILQPQWRSSSANELSIHLYGGAECEWRRQVYRPEDKVVEKGCLDLAQRYGELNQINKFICSYNYITERVGFIIENIINERVTGNVSVMRSIRGLKCKSQILPVNEEFYEQVTTIDGDTLLKLNEQVQLDIPCNQHFTVVLKLKGGIDSKFFRTFDFGC